MYIVAMLTMLIDHIGIVFFPDQELWRIVGRIAMPIYAYCLVIGYRHTRSKPLYIRRLTLLALLSQVPYVLALEAFNINIIGTFLVCLLVLMGLERYRGIGRAVAMVSVGAVVLELVPFDYGAYALLLVLMYRYIDQRQWPVAHLVLNVMYVATTGALIQMYSIIPTLVLVYWPAVYAWSDRIHVKRWVWRSFYPAHLAVLALIQLLR